MTRLRAVTVLAVLICLCVAAAVVLLRGREPAGPVSFPAGSLAPRGGALLGSWITPPGDFTMAGQQAAVTRTAVPSRSSAIETLRYTRPSP